MKNNTFRATATSVLTLATLCLLSANAAAQQPTWFSDDRTAQGHWMLGFVYGDMLHEGNDFKDATNAGILAGYEFARPILGNGRAAVEFVYTDTSDDGTFGVDSRQATTGTWSLKTIGVYVAARTAGTIYAKGKMGVVVADIDYDRDTGILLQEEESGASFGAGLGFRVNDRANIELDYTGSIGINDINYFSLGAMVLF